MEAGTKFKTVDEYLAALPEDARNMVKELRQAIKKLVPAAEEVISYNIPAFKLDGAGVIWYAGWKEHVSIYPRTRMMEEAIKELSGYEGAKGSIKFSLNKKLPVSVIGKIVKFRLKENAEKAAKKKKRK